LLKLKLLKLPLKSDPVKPPSGKVMVVYAHDPDGIILELVEDLENA
jgi:hypothetical protein